jgi:tRNA-2-methylthio-N6-dimethylallyladenosine synthase
MARALYIKSWGCQMNVYDARRMADVLAPLGYAPVDAPAGADMVILNTCHIRARAADKVFSELGRLKPLKDKNPAMLIAVGGCVAQAQGEIITQRAPYVDIVFGPQTWHRLPEMVAAARGGARVVNTDFPVESKFDHLPGAHAAPGPGAFVSVQEGCDRFCTFCVVPYTRGAEYSRPVAAVVDEVRALADAGAVEVTLLGQNVNAYHGAAPGGGSASLADLIGAVAQVSGVLRIRYTTSHPRDMGADLIAAHRDCAQLMPFLHLPVQSGSDRILNAMNRKHTAQDYIRTVSELKSARPDIALSSDFIVGFPGEGEADFEDTMRLVKEVGFASAYSFAFSARPGTPAAAMAHPVKAEVKTARLARLQALLGAQHIAFNQGFVGQAVDVLLDRPGRRAGQLLGRSAHNQPVHLAAPPSRLGQIVRARITRALDNSLGGEICA